MSRMDEIIHQPVRLRIMSALDRSEGGEMLDFNRLKAITQATNGNLGAHLTTLENAGYVAVHKDFLGKRPRTRIQLTAAGRRALRDHIAFLRELIEP